MKNVILKFMLKICPVNFDDKYTLCVKIGFRIAKATIATYYILAN